MHGFVTQVANPRAYLFFAAILPQFVDPRAPLAPQILILPQFVDPRAPLAPRIPILGVSPVLIELAVLAGYVAACGPARSRARHPRVSAPLQAAGGALLVAAGLRLAALTR